MFDKLIQKFQPKSPFEKERRLIIKQLLKKAHENAISEKEYNEYVDLTLKNRDYSKEEVNRFYKLDRRVQAATVHCDNLNDFKYALEDFGFADTLDLLAHENAHANKAEQLGVLFEGYYLKVIKTPDGNYIADIGANIDLERGTDKSKRIWSRSEKKEADIQITKAPDEYGNKMSDGDIDRVGRIEKEYKEE